MAASTLLLLLSPLLLLIALLIRLESKGPIFYAAKRVGKDYEIFPFFKFRSMYVGADKKLKGLKTHNQYAGGQPQVEVIEPICDKCKDKAGTWLVQDGQNVCKHYVAAKQKEKSGSFVKIAHDPRITKVGAFIRNTSLDELPQLWNVIRGEMSLVGNRPLPLYEAEKLTRDQAIARFKAPAGITGLWQVTKRGKAEMSEAERIELDMQYALHRNLLFDIQLLFKTFPALLQKENA